MELVPARYLQEMIAELRFDRALHRIDIRTKNNRIKLLYHHTWSKLPKVTIISASFHPTNRCSVTVRLIRDGERILQR